jgi:phage terminase large subunit-like protein
MSQQEHARIEGQRKGRYDAFMRGWEDGATRHKTSDDPDYLVGYEAGRQAKQEAQDAARKHSNHVPSMGIF